MALYLLLGFSMHGVILKLVDKIYVMVLHFDMFPRKLKALFTLDAKNPKLIGSCENVFLVSTRKWRLQKILSD